MRDKTHHEKIKPYREINFANKKSCLMNIFLKISDSSSGDIQSLSEQVFWTRIEIYKPETFGAMVQISVKQNQKILRILKGEIL